MFLRVKKVMPLNGSARRRARAGSFAKRGWAMLCTPGSGCGSTYYLCYLGRNQQNQHSLAAK